MFVANMDDPCLHGLTYIQQSEACGELGKKSFMVRGEEVPLRPEAYYTELQLPLIWCVWSPEQKSWFDISSRGRCTA